MSGKAKTGHINVRFDPDTLKRLHKLAAAKGLDLGAYLRMLIVTHPDFKR